MIELKCGNCGSEWKTEATRSSLQTVCPFCQEKLINEKSGSWHFFDNTKELLVFIATEYGYDALFNRKHFSDHSAPLMPQSQKNLIKQAYECGAVKVLQDNIAADLPRREIAIKQALRKMRDAYATSDEAARKVIGEFTNAIGWVMPEPQANAEPLDISGQIGSRNSQSEASVSLNQDIEALSEKGYGKIKSKKWKEGTKIFDEVINIDPKYAPAYIGRLLAKLKYKKITYLIGHSKHLEKYDDFNMALKFAEPSYLKILQEYVEKQNQRMQRLTAYRLESKRRINDLLTKAAELGIYVD